MRSIVGTWKLVSERAADSAGEPGALLYGGAPVGSATFTVEGRVVAVLTDGRMNDVSEPRPLTAFCGRYTFDGTRIVMHLEARPLVSQSLDDLKELLVARRALIKDRTAATNRDHVSRAPLLKRHASQRLRQIERQLEAIDAAMQSLCQADADLKARLAILVSIPGIGDATALAMLIEMPELGTIENKCVASLAGLAPIARDSGQTRGKRFIRGGRGHLRQALYMPALVAIRFNAAMKQKYEAFVAAGKPKKAAIVAVMRKLVVLANALLRDQRAWTPNSA